MQELTTEEVKQIKENYSILNTIDLFNTSSINFYDKQNKIFNLLYYDKIILKDKYYLCLYKESKSMDYYYKLDLRYNIIIHIE